MLMPSGTGEGSFTKLCRSGCAVRAGCAAALFDCVLLSFPGATPEDVSRSMGFSVRCRGRRDGRKRGRDAARQSNADHDDTRETRYCRLHSTPMPTLAVSVYAQTCEMFNPDAGGVDSDARCYEMQVAPHPSASQAWRRRDEATVGCEQ